jgi:YgiT-type zinc finger domain-containing protein
MKCVICNGSDIQMKTVQEEIKSGSDIFLVPMEVPVCSSCGERYYDRTAMNKIEEMRSRIKEKSLEVKEVGRVLRVKAA